MIAANDPKHRLWVAMRLGLGADAFPDICGSVAHEVDGQIIAATVFTNFSVFPESQRSQCWASMASLPNTTWCTRRYVRAFLAYPFDILGVCVLRTMCSRGNKDARRFNEKLGLKWTGIARRGWDGVNDAVHYDMLPKDATKWLGYEPKAWLEQKATADGNR